MHEKKIPTILIPLFAAVMLVSLNVRLFAMVLFAMVSCLLVEWRPGQTCEIARSGNE